MSELKGLDVKKINYLIDNHLISLPKNVREKVTNLKPNRQDIIKRIKYQCIIDLVSHWDIDFDEDFTKEYLQTWIDGTNYVSDEDWNKIDKEKNFSEFDDEDFKEFLKTEVTNEDLISEYTHIFNGIISYLDSTITKQYKTQPKLISILSLDNQEKTSIRFIKKAIVKLSGIDPLSLEAVTYDDFLEFFIETKPTSPGMIEDEISNFFKRRKLLGLLKILDKNDESLGLKDFDSYLVLPDIINENILSSETLNKHLFIEGISGSGKTVLAQFIAYTISNNNSFYFDLSEKFIDNYFIEENEKDIALFFKFLKKNNGTIVLDNIQHSDKAKYLTTYFLKIADKSEVNIVIVLQHEISIKEKEEVSYLDKFFDDEDIRNIKKNINIIGLTNNVEHLEIRFSMIKSLIQYYINRDVLKNHTFTKKVHPYIKLGSTYYKKEVPLNRSLIVNSKKTGKSYVYKTSKRIFIKDSDIESIEKGFGSALILLKYAIEKSKKVKKLNINRAREHIQKKYKLLIETKKKESFKFLLCYFSSENISFEINEENYYDCLTSEQILISKLVRKNLIYKLEVDNAIILKFPHNSIARLILDTVVKRENTSKEELLFKHFDSIKNIDEHLYNILIDIFINNSGYKSHMFIRLIERIVKNKVQLKESYLLDAFNHLIYISYYRDVDFLLVLKIFESFEEKTILNNFENFHIFISDLELTQSFPNIRKKIILLMFKNEDFLFQNMEMILNIMYHLKSYSEDKLFLELSKKLLTNEEKFVNSLLNIYSYGESLAMLHFKDGNIAEEIKDYKRYLEPKKQMKSDLLIKAHNSFLKTPLFFKDDIESKYKDFNEIRNFPILNIKVVYFPRYMKLVTIRAIYFVINKKSEDKFIQFLNVVLKNYREMFEIPAMKKASKTLDRRVRKRIENKQKGNYEN